MPEKLLSIKEVAEYLHLPEEEVKRLVDMGEIPAYKIGDTFLRFRKEQIDAIRSEITEFEAAAKANHESAAQQDIKARPYTELEQAIKRKEPVTRQYDYTFFERIKDFFYYNDFYLASFVIIALLLYLIFKT